jgi:hypothetical protein
MQLVATTCYVRGSGIFQKIFSFFSRAGKLNVVTCRFGLVSFSVPPPIRIMRPILLAFYHARQAVHRGHTHHELEKLRAVVENALDVEIVDYH